MTIPTIRSLDPGTYRIDATRNSLLNRSQFRRGRWFMTWIFTIPIFWWINFLNETLPRTLTAKAPEKWSLEDKGGSTSGAFAVQLQGLLLFNFNVHCSTCTGKSRYLNAFPVTFEREEPVSFYRFFSLKNAPELPTWVVKCSWTTNF